MALNNIFRRTGIPFRQMSGTGDGIKTTAAIARALIFFDNWVARFGHGVIKKIIGQGL